MTLFKEKSASNIPTNSPFPSGKCNSLNDLNTRERLCLKEFIVDIQSRITLHDQSKRLWEGVFRYISVGGSPNYPVSIATFSSSIENLPTETKNDLPPMGLVSEAGILFTMWCIRAKILGYNSNNDPANGESPDPEEMDFTKRPTILNQLIGALQKGGYYWELGKKNQFYELLHPDLTTITKGPATLNNKSRLMNMSLYYQSKQGKPEVVLNEIRKILALEIERGATCFYTGFFNNPNLFIGNPLLMASGDGSNTTGLMGLKWYGKPGTSGSNKIDGNTGQIFFGYEYIGNGQQTATKAATIVNVRSAGVGKASTIHLAIDGLDYPSAGGDPGYEGLNPSIPAQYDKKKSNTVVTILINDHLIKMRANRFKQTLTPIDEGDCFISPTPASPGVSGATYTGPNYSFISRKSSLLVATYNSDTGDITFTDLVGGDIEVRLISGYQGNLEEVIVYLSVVQAGGNVSRGVVDLFHPDKFELDLSQKQLLRTSFLNVKPVGSSETIGEILITTIQNGSNVPASLSGKLVSINSFLSQGFIGNIVSSSPSLVVNSDSAYYLTLDRSVRLLETVSPVKPQANKRRASMVGSSVSDNNISLNIVSFEDETWSRLDNKVVGTTSELTEPRFSLITDIERGHKLRTLDLKTEYSISGRPAISSAMIGPGATYTDIGPSTKHPDWTLYSSGGNNIADPSTQVTGLIPCYNPVLGGLRSFGALEALRDLLSVDSQFDYYTFAALHETLVRSTTVKSPKSPPISPQPSALGLRNQINYFEYQTFKWYDSNTSQHNIPNYHSGSDEFKILAPPGTGNSPNGGAYPEIKAGDLVDIYLCITKTGVTDKTINSIYYNDPINNTITISISDPQGDSEIVFYDDMDNPNIKTANGTSGTVEYRIYSIVDPLGPTGTPSTPYIRSGLSSNALIIGVGGVAKFAIKKLTAGTVTITATQSGTGAITTLVKTVIFV